MTIMFRDPKKTHVEVKLYSFRSNLFKGSNNKALGNKNQHFISHLGRLGCKSLDSIYQLIHDRERKDKNLHNKLSMLILFSVFLLQLKRYKV